MYALMKGTLLAISRQSQSIWVLDRRYSSRLTERAGSENSSGSNDRRNPETTLKDDEWAEKSFCEGDGSIGV